MTSARPTEPPGQAALISTRQRHRVATLTVRDDVLITVLSGRKSLIAPLGQLCVDAGQAVAMPRGTQWDVINDPSGSGRYEALVLTFDDALIRQQAAAMEPVVGAASAPVLQSARSLAPDDELREAVTRAASTLMRADSTASLRRHRLVEVLMLLAERGIRFRPGGELRWHDRIRRLVAHRPHHEWDAERVADALHLSASSLRRRLHSEDPDDRPARVGIAGIVREVRLETALGLLQTTRLPVGEIAVRCGWSSHSRFTAAFQSRWGFAPSLLRSPAVTREGEPLTHPG